MYAAEREIRRATSLSETLNCSRNSRACAPVAIESISLPVPSHVAHFLYFITLHFGIPRSPTVGATESLSVALIIRSGDATR